MHETTRKPAVAREPTVLDVSDI